MRARGTSRWSVLMVLPTCVLFAMGQSNEPQKISPAALAKEAVVDEGKGDWGAAYSKLQKAASQKPKDKKIAESLRLAAEHLSKAAASQALDSCKQQKLDACEKQAKQALGYARTPEAEEAERQLETRKAELQTHWDQAERMISAGQLEDANTELESLSRFPYLFPTLAAERERLRMLRVGAAIAGGNKAASELHFDAALEAFDMALSLDPGNAEATHGIEMAKRGKEAYSDWQQAQEALTGKQYEAAYLSDQKAVSLFPKEQEYQDLQKQIRAEWLPILEDETVLNPKPDDLNGNQKAWDNLRWIRRLDPDYQKLKETTDTVRGHLYEQYVQKANDFQGQPNNSGLAIAYLYHVNAQHVNPTPGGEDPFAASFTEVQNLFKRKRAMLILVSVANLSLANPDFCGVVDLRARAPIEGLGLTDVRLAAQKDYEANPTASEDPLFQDKRPDGKSRIAWLNVDIKNFQKGSVGNDKPQEKHSKFKSGVETIPNPEYTKLQEQYRKVEDSLKKAKPGKPSKEGYTRDDQFLLQKKLEQTQTNINQDKLVDYSYQEYHLSNSAHITLRLVLRDMLEQQVLASDEVDISRHVEGIEIAGAREADVNGLMNQPAHMNTPEQELDEAEHDALQALDEKVPGLLAKYTERYYKEGEKALAEGRITDGLENLICYWFTFVGRMDERHAQRIREVVKQNLGLEFPTSETNLP